jgi:hypothetical protein
MQLKAPAVYKRRLPGDCDQPRYGTVLQPVTVDNSTENDFTAIARERSGCAGARHADASASHAHRSRRQAKEPVAAHAQCCSTSASRYWFQSSAACEGLAPRAFIEAAERSRA